MRQRNLGYGALALTAIVVIGLIRLVRRDPQGRAATAVRLGLAAALVGVTGATVWGWARQGPLQWLDLLPLHLCDLLIFVAINLLVDVLYTVADPRVRLT